MGTTTATIIFSFIILLNEQYTIGFSSTPISTLAHISDNAPSWTDLEAQTLSTKTGERLSHEAKVRAEGNGPPHIDAKLRLFHDSPNNTEKSKEDVKITLYRDSAGWCPYCQKVWLTLEEKCIPYKVKTVPLNAYGDKPAWFTRLVDGGKLPALQLEENGGTIVQNSLDIIKLLDDEIMFPNHHNTPKMMPSSKQEKIKDLLRLEQELQSAWFSLVFYPVKGDALIKARDKFIATLQRVDDILAPSSTTTTTTSPWFLGGSSPSFVDIQYITHMERIIASVLYWKGIDIRDTSSNNNSSNEHHQFPNLEKWIQAFEARPSYIATKSDCYTLIMSIPSQNGPGYLVEEAKDISSKILGLDGAWNLRPSLASAGDTKAAEKVHRHEAAFALTKNHAAIVSFAARGASEPGRPSFHAELADPYAEANEDYSTSVDICLRYVTAALLHGVDTVEPIASKDLAGKAGDGTLRPNWGEYVDKENRTYWWNDETGDVMYQAAPTQQLDTCMAYLRDRVGVPRDMGEGAAIQLRAHLNWVISLLQ